MADVGNIAAHIAVRIVIADNKVPGTFSSTEEKSLYNRPENDKFILYVTRP
jgi:hypothetical protein